MMWGFGLLFMIICIVMMFGMMGHGHSMMGHGSAHEDWRGSDHQHLASSEASEILAERFARGEISEEEFEQRKQVLEGKPS
jgi:uncharacterized membrane protein